MNKLFKRIVGAKPYDYQKIAMENLVDSNSIIMRAPTGSGKTEIALIPFLYEYNNLLPSQLIYSLPTRTLVESIGERAVKYASFRKLRVAIHHGKNATSSLFEEDVVVTTIDQAVGAYLSTPLSMSKRSGNIFVGSVGSALTVFDEVHTLDPEKGLQTSLAISMQSAKLGLPTLIMSATLPDIFIETAKDRISKKGGDIEFIDVNDEFEIKSRKNRFVELINRLEEELNAEKVLEEVEHGKRIIIVINTVNRAQELYLELRNKTELPILLLHSRFLEKDRQEKELLLEETFGKNGNGKCIFIATQIVEVGMDISSPKVLSEIAPIDALIQRAGRCARWSGKGEFHVFGYNTNSKSPHAPYNKDIVEATKSEINNKGKSFTLDWNTEVELVNKILTKHFSEFMNSMIFYQRLGELARAVYEGSRAKVEQNVREVFSCDVTLHENPKSMNSVEILHLPRLRLDARTLMGKVEKIAEMGIDTYRLEENTIIFDDDEDEYVPVLVNNREEIIPFELYVLCGASYSSDTGLVFDDFPNALKSFDPEEKEILSSKQFDNRLKVETWVEHAKNTLKVLDNYMIPRYRYSIENFAENYGYNYGEFLDIIRCTVSLHDIGKLNKKWQKRIKWNDETPLAHSNDNTIKRLPAHATVSAKALQPYLEDLFDDEDIFKAFYLAIAHHHQPWSKSYNEYELVPKYDESLKEIWIIPKNFIQEQNPAGRLDFSYLDIIDENEAYRLYGFLSKLMRISDRLATGGNTYESLFSG